MEKSRSKPEESNFAVSSAAKLGSIILEFVSDGILCITLLLECDMYYETVSQENLIKITCKAVH